MFIFLLLPYFVVILFEIIICRLTILYTSIGTALKYVGMKTTSLVFTTNIHSEVTTSILSQIEE